MAKKAKLYVVWEGAKPGIYTTWDEAKAQIQGYPNAKYKAFETRTEAETAFKSKYSNYYDFSKKTEAKKPQNAGNQRIIMDSIAVRCSVQRQSGADGIQRRIHQNEGTNLPSRAFSARHQ